ncbi:hypothetical protein OIU76_018851, partial [Salix suchowensis]
MKRGVLKLLRTSMFQVFLTLYFHQLDVMDELSIASLANFITNQFGRLDVL